MNSRDFCYWLQGHLELTKTSALAPEQVDIIKKHLNLVFVHEIDPSYQSPDPKKTDKQHQENLQNIHQTPSLDGIKFMC